VTRAEIVRVLKLEAALASCQNALEAARHEIAQLKQRAKAKAKAKKERR
jgi:hypothetical protein